MQLLPGLDTPAWPTDIDGAVALERRLRPLLDLRSQGPERVEAVAGLDAAYDTTTDLMVGAAVVLDAVTGEVRAEASYADTARFPYVPGWLALRELPALLGAWERLDGRAPDLVLCDGYGVAHPRRFGLACYVGTVTGLPTIGVAKTRYIGEYATPPAPRGASTPIVLDGDVVGRSLRTQSGVREVLVSVGHAIDLDHACRHVLDQAMRYRIPEPLRAADHLSRATLPSEPGRGGREDGPPRAPGRTG